jgi:hypothetical protein
VPYSSRRPAVNPYPVGSGDYYEESYEQMLKRFCKRCGAKLVYAKKLNGKPIDNFMCPMCGWQPLKKEKEGE